MKIKNDILYKILVKIFKKYKLNSTHSKMCAKAIINAELVGAHSHGLSRLKMYCDRIKHRLINPKPKIKLKNLSQSITHIDADNCIGFVAAEIAIKNAISKAKKNGISIVGVKNSGHYGLSGYYAEMAASKNLTAICFTNAPPAIAPYGAKKSLFGTNPICFATPVSKKAPFIFDASMSKINRGKIRMASKQNNKIPYGVALDKNGKITTNAKSAIKGVQLPIAEFKGSGLAWMIDILSGVLTGSNHGGRVKDPFDDFSGAQNIGHLFIVFKSNIFVKNYNGRIKENIKRVKRLPKAKGHKEIMYPGENKFKRYKSKVNKLIKISNKINIEIQNLLNE